MAAQILRRGRLALLFEPRDFWVGGFWDSKRRILYVCPVPCLVVRWRLGPVSGALDINAIRYSRTKGTKMTDQAQSPHDDNDDGSVRSAASYRARDTALHLASGHADPTALERSAAENEERHRYEHTGPGTIRDHDEADLSWDRLKVNAVLAESEEEAPPGFTPDEEETRQAEPQGQGRPVTLEQLMTRDDRPAVIFGSAPAGGKHRAYDRQVRGMIASLGAKDGQPPVVVVADLKATPADGLEYRVADPKGPEGILMMSSGVISHGVDIDSPLRQGSFWHPSLANDMVMHLAGAHGNATAAEEDPEANAGFHHEQHAGGGCDHEEHDLSWDPARADDVIARAAEDEEDPRAGTQLSAHLASAHDDGEAWCRTRQENERAHRALPPHSHPAAQPPRRAAPLRAGPRRDDRVGHGAGGADGLAPRPPPAARRGRPGPHGRRDPRPQPGDPGRPDRPGPRLDQDRRMAVAPQAAGGPPGRLLPEPAAVGAPRPQPPREPPSRPVACRAGPRAGRGRARGPAARRDLRGGRHRLVRSPRRVRRSRRQHLLRVLGSGAQGDGPGAVRGVPRAGRLPGRGDRGGARRRRLRDPGRPHRRRAQGACGEAQERRPEHRPGFLSIIKKACIVVPARERRQEGPMGDYDRQPEGWDDYADVSWAPPHVIFCNSGYPEPGRHEHETVAEVRDCYQAASDIRNGVLVWPCERLLEGRHDDGSKYTYPCGAQTRYTDERCSHACAAGHSHASPEVRMEQGWDYADEDEAEGLMRAGVRPVRMDGTGF